MSAFCLSFLALQACQQDSTSEDMSAYLPKPMQLAEGCVWKTEELEVFEDPGTTVSFRHAVCDNSSLIFIVSNNGTRVEKASNVYYAVIFDAFHIFKRSGIPTKQFIKRLPSDISWEGANCYAMQISDRYWVFDDGVEVDASFEELPCGRYGRNFRDTEKKMKGQTIFEIRDDIILHYNIDHDEDGIDPASIEIISLDLP